RATSREPRSSSSRWRPISPPRVPTASESRTLLRARADVAGVVPDEGARADARRQRHDLEAVLRHLELELVALPLEALGLDGHVQEEGLAGHVRERPVAAVPLVVGLLGADH